MDSLINPLAFDQPELSSERLLLRKLSMDDAEAIFEYASQDEVTRFMLWDTNRTIEETRTFLKMSLEAYDAKVPGIWAIVYKPENKVIGTLGMHNYRPQHFRVEIGYVIAKPYWGRGIMTEAVKTVLTFCFETMGLNRVDACCFDGNIASERVILKSGMKYEGTLREFVFVKGKLWDVRMFSILRREYSMT
ncbi:MAG: GNAT family N-acetyltransferase [bacterium]|nr:GNAT family N-acetyltransferase [bacterium]